MRGRLLCLLLCIGSALGQPEPGGRSVVLENSKLRVRLSAKNAAVLEVYHKERNVSYLAGSEQTGWFQLQIPLPNWEGHTAASADLPVVAVRRLGRDAVEFSATRVRTREGIFPVTTTLTFRLVDDNLTCQLSVRNRGKHRIDKVVFPIVDVPPAPDSSETLQMPSFVWPLAYAFSKNELRSERNPFDALDPLDLKAWFYSDPRIGKKGLDYPMTLPTAWVVYVSQGRGVGLEVRDKSFQFKKFMIERRLLRDPVSRAANRRDYELSWNWYPIIAPGESWETDEVYLKFGGGDWHEYASQHRDWLRPWIGRPSVPEKFKASIGWVSRGIRSFDEIPSVARQGVEVGAPYFIIYGWSAIGPQGMSYGAYPRTELGGVESLRKNLREARSLGSHPMAWFNGTVSVETNLEHQAMGRNWIATNRWGGELIDGRWSFFEPFQIVTLPNNDNWMQFDPSTGVKEYWLATVRRMVEEYQFSGFEMDQGHKNYLSYRGNNPQPQLAFTKGYGEFFERAQKIVKTADPNGIIVGENPNEHMNQYVDATWIFEGGDLDVERLGRLRYSMPWATISAKAVATDPGHANRAFLLNSPLDIFDDLGRYPDYKSHLQRLHALKKATARYLYEGEFSDQESFSLEPPKAEGIIARCYRDPQGRFLAVVIVNTTKKAQQIVLRPQAAFAAKRALRYHLDGPVERDGFSSESPLNMAPFDVKIVVFEDP